MNARTDAVEAAAALPHTQTAVPSSRPSATPRVCVIGPGTRFLSGVTYVTYGMVNELAQRGEVSALLARNLLPTRLYPGAQRVGTQLTELELADDVPVYDGFDWSWGSSMIGALAFLRRERPEVVHFHWWTGTTLHSYLLLAACAKRLGAKIVIELHETLDTGEDKYKLVAGYVNRVAPRFFRMADAYTVHSAFDRDLVATRFGIDPARIVVVPHAEVSHYATGRDDQRAATRAALSIDDEGTVNLLHFGVIRPYKGLEDLQAAFDALPEDEARRYHLTVVGEPWEGTEWIIEALRTSRHRDRITIIDRYVDDDEADAYFQAADMVVLPYRRSSQSGPLHVAMSYGLPIVVTDVGGLGEAAGDYGGAVLCPPADPAALTRAIRRALPNVGQRYATDRTWTRTTDGYVELFRSLVAPTKPTTRETSR